MAVTACRKLVPPEIATSSKKRTSGAHYLTIPTTAAPLAAIGRATIAPYSGRLSPRNSAGPSARWPIQNGVGGSYSRKSMAMRTGLRAFYDPAPKAASKGTLREHKPDHARPRAGHVSSSDPGGLRDFRARGDPRVPERPSSEPEW